MQNSECSAMRLIATGQRHILQTISWETSSRACSGLPASGFWRFQRASFHLKYLSSGFRSGEGHARPAASLWRRKSRLRSPGTGRPGGPSRGGRTVAALRNPRQWTRWPSLDIVNFRVLRALSDCAASR